MTRFLLAGASALPFFILPVLSPAASADSSQSDETIVITGERRDALAEALAEKARRPGNVDVVPAEEFRDRYATTFRDALALTPGVIMQPSAGEDGRLSIRGSGLAQNVHLRGVEVLLGGVPMNAADGFGDLQEVDLLVASHIDVLKGGNAFRVGAATLGGAISVETLTAKSVATPHALRAEAGSFGTSRLHAVASRDFGRFDMLVAGTWQRQDGFRDHSQQNNERGYVNIGYEWSDRAETRFGLFYNDVDQELAGSVSLDTALGDPAAGNSGAISQDWQRDIDSLRAYTTTTIKLDGGTLTFGGTAARRDLYHPVPVFLIQEAEDYSGFLRYDGGGTVAGRAAAWSIGMRLRETETDADVYLNFAGAIGPQITDSVQESGSAELYGEGRLEIAPGLWAIVGANWLETSRDFENLADASRNAQTSFSHLSPKLGLLYEASATIQVFANASASHEPPTFLDLTQGGVAGFQPIEAQDAVSYEAGARGTVGDVSFEAAVYRQEIDGEFVAFTTTPGIPAAIFNADETIHQGAEIFASWQALRTAGGLSVTPQLSWGWNDFAFDGDAIYGDNRLAGMPEHFGRLQVVVAGDRFRIAPSVTVQAGDNFLDYANTVDVPGYELYGVEASWDLSPGMSLFVEGRNLTDEAYAVNYSTLADARDPSASLNVFVPGEGRAIYGGIRLGFGGSR
ncbi:TonB-dependent receptor family protein [Aquisalinus flavus]|uniref:TonB-dependent receptor n=1 Tax=Aquisalinus flavus TaxID=1526572 RepID=A0A8J2Y5G2_9PROT|nr:TonB-dependent receptor [Aquisalinus flavus]MBD0425832.1 TonB-dependent receptor [Aquisalinus flavus]UNE48565.1 TonB-dependent receptor [Aquisalinus flavus]GGD12899.1 TonB-dependent receptor [Aquisalinus flavus]